MYRVLYPFPYVTVLSRPYVSYAFSDSPIPPTLVLVVRPHASYSKPYSVSPLLIPLSFPFPSYAYSTAASSGALIPLSLSISAAFPYV